MGRRLPPTPFRERCRLSPPTQRCQEAPLLSARLLRSTSAKKSAATRADCTQLSPSGSRRAADCSDSADALTLAAALHFIAASSRLQAPPASGLRAFAKISASDKILCLLPDRNLLPAPHAAEKCTILSTTRKIVARAKRAKRESKSQRRESSRLQHKLHAAHRHSLLLCVRQGTSTRLRCTRTSKSTTAPPANFRRHLVRRATASTLCELRRTQTTFASDTRRASFRHRTQVAALPRPLRAAHWAALDTDALRRPHLLLAGVSDQRCVEYKCGGGRHCGADRSPARAPCMCTRLAGTRARVTTRCALSRRL